MTTTVSRAWWGGTTHVVYTIVVFVILASLDNAAIALIPSMVPRLRETFDVSTTAIGVLTGAQILVTAVTAVVWGYLADSRDRKKLLLWGTVIWSAAVGLSGFTTSYWSLLGLQIIAGIGLGSIASVGFSVISDFIAPRRRGLAMSFWGLSQGIGSLVGSLLASQAGAQNHTAPFVILAAAGFLFSLLFLTTFDAPRGYKEPDLQEMYARGETYEYSIDAGQIEDLRAVKTNTWLVLQGLTAQVAYGSLVWVPLLYQEKVIAEGYSQATGQQVGGLFAALFTVGALFSILFGHIGDRWQRRNLSGRAYVSAIGILGAIPFFLVFFWVPLRGLEVTDGASTATFVPEVLAAIVTNPWVALAFLSAIIALALTSADSPNWFALISDVNVPEHRGTVFGVGNFINGIGRAVGTGLTTVTADTIRKTLPPPFNLALGLSLFQVFFLPTGWCYWKASKTCPADIEAVRATLRERANIDDGSVVG
ncbi:MAG: MFS transporter [Acidimicrobiia bacterium]|nr:MAG: MFS transporter [Acidimicrobiia bacterium]